VYLFLTADAALELAALDEADDELLEHVDGDHGRGAHELVVNGRERLE